MSAVMSFVFVVELESSWICFHVLDLVGQGRVGTYILMMLYHYSEGGVRFRVDLSGYVVFVHVVR